MAQWAADVHALHAGRHGRGCGGFDYKQRRRTVNYSRLDALRYMIHGPAREPGIPSGYCHLIVLYVYELLYYPSLLTRTFTLVIILLYYTARYFD